MEKKNIKLYESPVIAIDDNCEVKELQHTYFSGSTAENIIESMKASQTIPVGVKQYHGITSTLLNYALGDAYAGWDGQMAANRDKAAQRGHEIHKDIETMCKDDANPVTLEGWNFRNYAKEHGWTIIANEYIVDDDDQFASAIDLLFLDANGDLCIGDIKTYSKSTAKTKTERTSLQCSIYKWMFNLHNEYEIKHLYEVRLRDEEYEVTELRCVPEDKVVELVEAYKKQDKEYKYEPTPEWMYELEQQYTEITAKIAEYTDMLNAVKKSMHVMMMADNLQTVRGTSCTVSICKGRTTTKFDDKRFQQEHPEAAIDYMVQTFDTKAFLKDHKKDDDVKDYITETTAEPTLRIVTA